VTPLVGGGGGRGGGVVTDDDGGAHSKTEVVEKVGKMGKKERGGGPLKQGIQEGKHEREYGV